MDNEVLAAFASQITGAIESWVPSVRGVDPLDTGGSGFVVRLRGPHPTVMKVVRCDACNRLQEHSKLLREIGNFLKAASTSPFVVPVLDQRLRPVTDARLDVEIRALADQIDRAKPEDSERIFGGIASGPLSAFLFAWKHTDGGASHWHTGYLMPEGYTLEKTLEYLTHVINGDEYPRGAPPAWLADYIAKLTPEAIASRIVDGLTKQRPANPRHDQAS